MFLYLKKRVFEHVMKDLEMSIDYPGCGHQPRSAVRSWKKQGAESPLEPAEGGSAITLISAQ